MQCCRLTGLVVLLAYVLWQRLSGLCMPRMIAVLLRITADYSPSWVCRSAMLALSSSSCCSCSWIVASCCASCSRRPSCATTACCISACRLARASWCVVCRAAAMQLSHICITGATLLSETAHNRPRWCRQSCINCCKPRHRLCATPPWHASN